MHTLRNAVILSGVLGGLILTTGAHAQTQMRVLGGFSNQYQNAEVEKPFFTELGANADVQVTFRAIDEMGLKGYDAFRQLQSGLFDVMAISPGYVSGDDPFVLGIDLPGTMPTLEQAKAAADAIRTVLADRIMERFNGELLTIWPYPASVLFCSGEIASLADLAGKKVRVPSPGLAQLIEHFGGTSVTLPFSDVYLSLQRGLVDCATAASLSGNTANLHEVTDTLYTLPLSWTLQLHVANGDYWQGLDETKRSALSGQFAKLEEQMWSVADKTTQDGLNCNAGKDPCEFGKKGSMKLVDPTDEDRNALQQAVQSAVLPKWASECDAAFEGCSRIWNETVGKAVGLTIQ